MDLWASCPTSGNRGTVVTLLKISKVSKSIFYYILINFVKYKLAVIIFLQINTVGHMTIFYPK